MRRTSPLALLCVGLLSIGLAPAAQAAGTGRVFHLAVDGDDPTGTNPSARQSPDWCSTGTAARPFGTFDYALRCLEPGDTLIVHEGTYRERVQLNAGDGHFLNEGRADAPILVTGAADEDMPVIEGLLRLQNVDHWTVHGIGVTDDGAAYGAGDYLVKVRGGTGWGMESLQVWDGRSYANVRVEEDSSTGEDSTWWRIVGSCIHTTARTHTQGFLDHNMYLAPGYRSGPGLVADNVMWGAPNGENIKVGSGPGARDILIRDNILMNATQNVLVTGAATGIDIRENVIGPLTGGKAWYPNVRGYALTGAGNIAVSNIMHGASDTVLTGSDGGASTQQIREYGTVRTDPGILGAGCGMQATAPVAADIDATEAFDRSQSNGRVALNGDWDGDGDETAGWWDPFTATFSLTNSHATGPAELRIRLGEIGDRPMVGDWDGDGVDEVGVRHGNQFRLALGNVSSPPVRTFRFGSEDDKIVAGDWDGDGHDTVGVIRIVDGRVTWFLTNDVTPGPNAEIVFAWGSRRDHILTGDWDGDGRDGPGVVRDNQWFLDNGFAGGRRADVTFRFGSRGDTVVTGDWDGDGDESVAVVRGLHWFLTDSLRGGFSTLEYTLGP